jgi:PAS domain S-box-containing protein
VINPSQQSKGNILIVDDNQENLKTLASILKQHGFQVRPAISGSVALKAAFKNPPDLILLDIIMPDMVGYDVCEQLKANDQTRDIPVIFISVLGETSDKVKAFKAGGVDYITKPFQEEEILARMETHLRLRQLELSLKKRNRRLEQEMEERRQAEEASKETRRQLSTLMSNLPGMAYRCGNDPDWTFRFASEGCLSLTGYKADELVGNAKLSYGDLIHEDDRQMVWDTVQTALKNKNPFNLTYRIITADQRESWVWEQGRGILDANGNIVALEGFIADITERKLTERTQKKLEAQLFHVHKMESIGTLTGGIAHDYNNLLSIIMGNLSMAVEEVEPGSDLAQFLSEVTKASRKIRDLTHELMALSKGGAPVKELGSLRKLLQSAADAILYDSDISLQESIPQDLWPVPHDPHKMGAVFRNIWTNAVEAMPHGGTLTVSAENRRVGEPDPSPDLPLKPGDYVFVSIQDEGVGIPEEHLVRIFDPYFSTKAMGVQKGMGLGLATAYAIVQKHGGHMAIRSTPGEGTLVEIYLPAESTEEQGQKAETAAPVPQSTILKVLVMDDEEMLRELLEQMLNRLGYAAVTVKDGMEAVRACKKQMASGEPFDAVILDLTIKGGMGGERTIGELLKIDPHMKAIVCSGYFDDPVMSDFETYGFVGSIAKPYEKNNLKEALEKVLRASS